MAHKVQDPIKPPHPPTETMRCWDTTMSAHKMLLARELQNTKKSPTTAALVKAQRIASRPHASSPSTQRVPFRKPEHVHNHGMIVQSNFYHLYDSSCHPCSPAATDV